MFNKQLEIRKIKFLKSQKQKVQKFYLDLNRYLTEAYFEFELTHCRDTMGTKEWLNFNKKFRREYTS